MPASPSKRPLAERSSLEIGGAIGNLPQQCAPGENIKLPLHAWLQGSSTPNTTFELRNAAAFNDQKNGRINY